MTDTHHLDTGGRHQREKRLIGADEFEVVKTGINRGGIRHAVEKAKRACTGVHLIRRK